VKLLGNHFVTYSLFPCIQGWEAILIVHLNEVVISKDEHKGTKQWITWIAHAFYFIHPVYIIRVIKSNSMRWAGHVTLMREIRNGYKIYVGESETSEIHTKF
jgi:hypothetical protein